MKLKFLLAVSLMIAAPEALAQSGKIVFGVVCGDRMGLIDGFGAEILPMSRYTSLQQMWDRYLNPSTK